MLTVAANSWIIDDITSNIFGYVPLTMAKKETSTVNNDPVDAYIRRNVCY